MAYAIEHADQVRRLVLVGSVSGFPSIQRNGGGTLRLAWTDPSLWRFIWWGLRLSTGRGNLAVHKRVVHLIRRVSHVNRALVPELEIAAQDAHLPAPIRDRWPMVAREYDYAPRLREVRAPTLLCVGRRDPQAPVGCAEELARSISDARLVVFEQSGHYPYMEERDKFSQTVREFLCVS